LSTLASVIAKGLYSAIPAAGIAGRLYFATDTQLTWYDTGTAWVNVTFGGAPGSSGFVLTSAGPTAAPIWASAGGGSTFQPSALPNPPALSAFTWVNQGTNTTSNNGNSILITFPSVGGLSWGILKKTAPSTPWSAACFMKATLNSNGGASVVGLYLYDGTKLLGMEILDTGSFPVFRVERLNNVTTDNSTVFTQPFANANLLTTSPMTGGMYLRWRNDATTLFADYSLDGSNWINVYSEAVGAFVTPTAYGFGGLNDGMTQNQYLSLQGWLETNSATL
jgi:hypothetical protein